MDSDKQEDRPHKSHKGKLSKGEHYLVTVADGAHIPEGIGEYIGDLMRAMQLRDWCVNVSAEPCPKRLAADMTSTYGLKVYRLRLNANWRSFSRRSQRQTLVHELLHIHVNPMKHCVEEDLSNLIGMPAWTMFWARFKSSMEYCVDPVAASFASYLPLPPKVKKAPKAKKAPKIDA